MTRFFIDRPIFSWVISIVILLGGAVAVFVLPVAQFSPMAPIFFPSREGWLFGSDYTIAGPPSAPVLRIDPLHSLAPVFLRKLFEFKPGEDRLAP